MKDFSRVGVDDALIDVVWTKYAEISNKLNTQTTASRLACLTRIYPNIPIIAIIALFNALEGVKTSVDR